jgi:hypothetical protein
MRGRYVAQRKADSDLWERDIPREAIEKTLRKPEAQMENLYNAAPQIFGFEE